MTRREYVERLVAEDLREPVLIWQMGKVGSRSLVGAIERTGDYAVFHIHHTNRDSIASVRAKYDERGEAYPTDLRLSMQVLKMIDSLLDQGERKIRVVSAVRDPLARNVSAFFQNLKLFAGNGVDEGTPDARRLTEVFLTEYEQTIPLTWFDREVKATLGIDVYSMPFDRERARLRVSHGAFDLIVLRAEDEDKAKDAALTEFFERNESLNLARINVGSNKRYADLYGRFLEALVVPEQLLDTIYDSRLCRHFYTDDERRAMRNRWRTA